MTGDGVPPSLSKAVQYFTLSADNNAQDYGEGIALHYVINLINFSPEF